MRDKLTIFGDKWPTPDGTGVRDYLHVDDLANGHLKSLDFLVKKDNGGCFVHNLGTGNGNSVLEMKDGFERASGVKIPFIVGPERPGDLGSVIADPAKAEKELGWKATRNIDEVMSSAWKWQSNTRVRSSPSSIINRKFHTRS